MEYCEVGTLDSLLFGGRSGQPFSEGTSAAILKMLLLGLQHLHTNRKIHRDIKGANVLVNIHGECKLADFGLSRTLSQDYALSLCGTPFFV